MINEKFNDFRKRATDTLNIDKENIKFSCPVSTKKEWESLYFSIDEMGLCDYIGVEINKRFKHNVESLIVTSASVFELSNSDEERTKTQSENVSEILFNYNAIYDSFVQKVESDLSHVAYCISML